MEVIAVLHYISHVVNYSCVCLECLIHQSKYISTIKRILSTTATYTAAMHV